MLKNFRFPFWTGLLVIGSAAVLMAEELVPFGQGVAYSPKAVKSVDAKSLSVDCLGPDSASLWMVENPKTPEGGSPFGVEQEEGAGVLHLKAGLLEPARSTVRLLLPGDGPKNGDVWAKSQASYISFLYKSNKPGQMTFHLLQRGKTAGSFSAGFSIEPGEWRKVVLPLSEFGLKSFGKVAGLGFRAVSVPADTEVSFKSLQVGGMPFNETAWSSHKLSISINGDWKFATDPGDQGAKEKWFETAFNDQPWKALKSGESWQNQGVEHYGWGWYRQKLFIPKEAEGLPVRLTLTSIPSDDDTWFNGTRVGGFSSEYKYKNLITRVYTIPPSLVRYGELNSIALRIWGGNITFIGNDSGLIKGPLVAELDPYGVFMKEPGGQAVPASLFDLTDAQRGKPFEVVFSFPADLGREAGAVLRYRLLDYSGAEILSGKAPLQPGRPGAVQAVVAIGREAAQTVYLRGRFRASLLVENASGAPLYTGMQEVDQLTFARRDNEPLPSLAGKEEETPYGKLKLIDEIDGSVSVFEGLHPYLQGGFDEKVSHCTPGSPSNAKISEILGKKARETDYGWFAYRIGRGKLKPRSTYLLRIEYPEDQPRFAPIEIQVGQNFMDVGWKNGVAPDDVYDNWPLSKKWQWYDVIVPLDDQTTGTGGTGSAPAENGFWVYFMNKIKPGAFYTTWQGGPAVARMKLYEIDPEKNAPVIRKPEGLPQRVFSFDWERQADHDPADLVKYAKLMGYSAISPIMIKWHFMNFSDPLSGYDSITIDDRDHWARRVYKPGEPGTVKAPYPEKKSQHVRYLEATKKYQINYIPRFEWGGSMDLPEEARAIGVDGKPAKPNRFSQWCANLLHPAAWDDLQKLMDHLIKPYVKDNPQLTGALWRIRCDRMPISYGPADLELFAKETGTKLPAGGEAQVRAWATGEGRAAYDDWWHKKRVDFHKKLSALLQSYRSDMDLYYYNWDGDKFGLILPDITAWAFKAKVMKPAPEGGLVAYQAERAERKKLTAEDYIETMRTGNFGEASKGINRADYGIRPDLYKDAKGIQLFAPANYLCYADKPAYLNYFQVADGLAVSNVVSYDEVNARMINPKYEGNMITPGGAPFSMALELLPYFHGDARTLNYTVYTYGRGFADAHRRFAQAFLALPAIPGTVVDQGDADVKVRTYASAKGTYVGLAYKGYAAKKLSVKIPAKDGAKVTDLVSGKEVPVKNSGGTLSLEVDSGPMELNAYLIQ